MLHATLAGPHGPITLYLFFKAYQPGLFDSPVEVTGHVTKRGTVVAPYRSTRKKRPEPPPAPDLFAEADRRAMEEDRKKAEEAARQEKERQEREAEAAKKEAERKAQEEAEKAAKKAKPAKKAQEDDSDDPNSPNYRFRDTGYIAGSRKEDAARFIRAAGRDGRRVNPTDIDWEQIEQNPREAKELITKSNLFGSVDWEALKAGGMEPAAGFLVDRVYASIAKEPSENDAGARKLFAVGLQSVRDRLERCKTASEVTKALAEMREELDGTMLTAEQAESLRPLIEKAQEARQKAIDGENEIDKRWKNVSNIGIDLNAKRYEQEKRTRRGWKPDPDIAREIESLEAAKKSAEKEWSDYRDAHPEAVVNHWTRDLGGGRTEHRSGSELSEKHRALNDAIAAIKAAFKKKNVLENPLFSAWITLGPRFVGVLNYRSYKGSDAFGDHVARAKAGKITDWSWAEKTTTAAPKIGEKEKAFALKVIDKYERKGGRKVTIDSTAALKQAYGLRDVQSGNWVLDDPTSAKWHVQQAAEAFADLADLFQVPDHIISMNGRLALAFGARGKGNAGFGGAARAHYEPVQRVINITKMGGGGCLAHEWFHGLDNLIGEMESGKPTGKEYFATESAQTLPGELGTAMRELGTAMTEGPHRHHQEYTYTSHDVKTAELNMRPRPNDYGTPAPVKIIRDAGNVHDAVQRIQDYFATSKARNVKKLEAGWTTIAVAHYGADPNGGTLKVKAGPARSFFAHEAVKLDKGTPGKYWSQPKELAARAFQAYVEDKMAAMGRQSDYLSAMADNKYYRDPFFGDQHPFPEGEERTRINAAFDKLLAAIKEHRILEKAFRAMTARYLFLKAA